MAIEIERKFLVDPALIKPILATDSLAIKDITQHYLITAEDHELRIRFTIDVMPKPDNADIKAELTTKAGRDGAARFEVSTPINTLDALRMITLLPVTSINKRRHILDAGNGLKWEVDVYKLADGSESVVAEIELPSADHPFERPEWLGHEVTGFPAWDNKEIAARNTPDFIQKVRRR